MYQAVIFDFDDTLVESRVLKWAQHKYVAKKFYNLDLSDEEIRKHYGKPLNQLIADLYQNSDTTENIHKVIASVRNDYLKKVYVEAPGVLKKLLSNNIKVGIVSATNKNYLVDDLDRLDFPVNDFFIIQGSDEVSAHKPEPGVFFPALDILSKIGIKKDQIVYIGDSLDDLKAAHGAGIDFIGLTTGLYKEEEFKAHGAKVVLSRVGEVLDFILK